MVGYVLGLGDRHPSNLMLGRISGKIMHIDFGDCFEVAMTREKFPEKIPFRLTRMLINAMEVTSSFLLFQGFWLFDCSNSLVGPGTTWNFTQLNSKCIVANVL